MKKIAAAAYLGVMTLSGCAASGRPPPGPAAPQAPAPARLMAPTVFVDEYSKAGLRLLHADPAAVLARANLSFKKEGIAATYDLSRLRLRETPARGRIDRFWAIVNFMLERARAEFPAGRPESAEVAVFLTGRLNFGACLAVPWDDVYSKSALAGKYARFFPSGAAPTGGGVILLGTATEAPDPDGARKLALLLIHEQAHLYGVGHSEEKDSLMHARSDRIIGGDFATVRLDPHSRRMLP